MHCCSSLLIDFDWGIKIPELELISESILESDYLEMELENSNVDWVDMIRVERIW